MVRSDFDTGMTQNDYDELSRVFAEDEDYAKVADEAAEYYLDLVQLGPEGFAEEYPEDGDEEDYIEDEDEYSEDEESDTDDEDYETWHKNTFGDDEPTVAQQKAERVAKVEIKCSHCDVKSVDVKQFGIIIEFGGKFDDDCKALVADIREDLKNEGFENINSTLYGTTAVINYIPGEKI